MDEQLQELSRRLERLDCLATPTKDYILEVSRSLRDEQPLRDYLAGPLAFVEKYLAAVDHPGYRSLCQQLRTLTTSSAVLSALGVAPGSDDPGWMKAAFQFQLDSVRCLYCLANHFAWPSQDQQDTPDLRVVCLSLLAMTLRFLGRGADGAAILEYHLGLARGDYRNPELLAARLTEELAELSPKNATSLLVSLAEALRFLGRETDAAALLECHLGLVPGDYRNAETLSTCLGEKHANLTANNAAHLLVSLADVLRYLGRGVDGAALLECHFGLQTDDYRRPETLVARLADRLAELTPNNAANLLVSLADTLWLLDRKADEAALLECHLGLSTGGYPPPEALAARLVERLANLTPNNAAHLVSSLADALRAVDRQADEAALLECHLGLKAADYPQPAVLGRRLAERLSELTPNNRAHLLDALADALRFLGRGTDGTALLESYFGLTAGNYRRPETLGARLTERLADLSPRNATHLIAALADSLRPVGRGADGAALLEWHLGLARGDYRRPEILTANLTARLADLTTNDAVHLLLNLADLLRFLGRGADAAALLECHFGLEQDDYRRPESLGSRLAARLADVEPRAAAQMLASLADALRFLGRWTDAAALVEFQREDFGLLKAEQAQALVPENVALRLIRWFEVFGRQDRARSLGLCRRLLSYLRRSVQRSDVSPDDRTLFIEHLASLRLLVIQTAHHWIAEETDADQGTQLRLEVLCWDAELGQRLLLERLLLGSRALVENDGQDTPALALDRPAFRQAVGSAAAPARGLFGMLSKAYQKIVPTKTAGSGQSAAADSLGCFEFQSEPTAAEVKRAPSNASQPRDHAGWLDTIQDQLRESVEARSLAQTLAPQEVLLWAGCTLDGSLFWTAYRRNGGELDVIAVNSGGQRGERDRLRLLSDWHGFHLAMIWACVFALRDRPGERERIQTLLDQVNKLLSAADKLADLPGIFSKLCAVLGQGSRAEALLRQGRPLLLPPANPVQATEWAAFTAKQWRPIAELPRATTVAQIEQALDQRTGEFLEAVGQVWNLAALLPQLSASTDVIVQAGDALRAVPAAFLRVGGQPLFQQVRSVRSLPSLLVADLQRRGEESVTRQEPGRAADRPRLLTASWFKPDDKVPNQTARQLHLDQQKLAQEFGLDWYSVAEEPAATPQNLARGLARSAPFRVGTVCAHCGPSGVILSEGAAPNQGRQRGNDLELSGVEFLIEICCTLSRRDAEDFCETIVLSKTRSVLAARWPIQCGQAGVFANTVIRHYLSLRRTEQPNRESCLRARAVNLAQRELLETTVTPPGGRRTVGLNTAAAFELHGLG